MPKQTLVVKNFQKGLNTKLDDRDLTPGDLSQAIDIDVSTAGRVRCLGSLKGSYLADPDGVDVNYGYGLFAFAHDYDMFNASTGTLNAQLKDAPAQTNTDYLVKSSIRAISIYDFTHSNWLSFGNILTANAVDSSATGYEPNFYSTDGALRVTNGKNIADVPFHLAHIKRNYFSSGTDININSWIVSDAHPLPPPNVANNGILIYPFDNSAWDAGTDPTNIIVGYGFHDDELGTWDISGGNYPKFYGSYVYDGGQESALTPLVNSDPIDDPTVDSATNNMSLHLAVCLKATTTNSFLNVESSGGNRWKSYETPRLAGAKIYFSLIKDSTEAKYLLLDIDFTKGIRKGDSSTYEAWADEGASAVYECPAASFESNHNDADGPTAGETLILKDPPSIYSYESQTGHFAFEETSATFKSSCLLNRRIYAGNVIQNGVSYNDRMIKSPVNSFDKFPELNLIDAAINDGDDIVKLVAFGDRILQFKRKTLYVINASQDQEYLEAQYALMGIDRPYQSVDTPYGIVWCNRSGVYIYSGEGTIANITRDKLDTATDWDWQTDTDGRGLASIGFDDKSDKIIIMRNVKASGTRADEILVYDMRTKSWVFGDDKVTSSANKSNMFLDPTGNLIWTYAGSAALSIVIDDCLDGTLANVRDGGTPAIRFPVRFVKNQTTTPDGDIATGDLAIWFEQNSSADLASNTFDNLQNGDLITISGSGFADKDVDGIPLNYRSVGANEANFDHSYATWKGQAPFDSGTFALPATSNNDGTYKVVNWNTTAVDQQALTDVDGQTGSAGLFTKIEVSRSSSSNFLNDFNWKGKSDVGETDITATCTCAHQAGVPAGSKYALLFTTADASAHNFITGMTICYTSGGTLASGTDAQEFPDVKKQLQANGGATVIVASATTFYLVANAAHGDNNHDLEIGDVIGHIDALGSSSAYNSGTPDRVGAGFVFTYYISDIMGFLSPNIGNHWTEHGGDATVRSTTISVSNLLKWEDAGTQTAKYQWKTREIDFGSPGVRKKIYSIYVTFKCTETLDDGAVDDVGDSNVRVKFHWVGPTGNSGSAVESSTPSNHTNYDITEGFQNPGLDNFITGKVVPKFGTGSDELPNNVYSLKLEFYCPANKVVPMGFEINDITIIYRQKGVK